MYSSAKEWSIIGGSTAAAVIVGWLTDAFPWMLLLAAGVLLAVQHRELVAFRRWARKPLSRPDNGLESWRGPVESVFRTLQRSRSRTRDALDQLQALRVVTEALPDAAIIVDRLGNIRNLNRAAAELLHLRPADRGANLAALIRQPDFVALVRGQVGEELVEFASPLDENRRFEARRVELPGESRQSLLLVRDVTQLNRLLSMRQDFVANVSHELRTPLTVIVGYLETLVDEPVDAETTRELVDKLTSPTRRMQALVEDLLLLTRLEASPNPTPEELCAVDMNGVIESVATEARALSGGKHHIETHVESTLKVLGIERELHSACSNLVSNAVRYSPDGGQITISWCPAPTGVRLSVSDHGMGIPKTHLSRLTERFYRVDFARSRVRGGTGLGLAIVKHVLKRHDSELQIESRLGAGSTFYCEFPHTRLVNGPSFDNKPINTQEAR